MFFFDDFVAFVAETVPVTLPGLDLTGFDS